MILNTVQKIVKPIKSFFCFINGLSDLFPFTRFILINMGCLRYISFMKIIVIITTFCAGDIVFDRIRPQTQNLFHNNSNIWHKYTVFFLQSNLLKSIHDKLNPQKIYFYLLNMTTRFRLSLKSIKWKA